MDFIYLSLLILLFLLNAKKSGECDNGDVIVMAGCNISLTWTLPKTRKDILALKIGKSFQKPIATSSDNRTCSVRDNSSSFCNINDSDNGHIIVLTIFNVTSSQSGNYRVWNKSISEHPLSSSKRLVVIGKPNIMTERKPILGQEFQITCNATQEQERCLYRWKINGVERTTVHNVNSQTISSLAMIDNYSNVTCQVCLNEKASNLPCLSCKNDGCSIDSDPYAIQVIYGPDNVSLSRGERNFYLKEHEIFMIDCFANCYPNCIFWWKGHDTIESQKLYINFESRMSGQYACHVRNQETNVTLISDPITLHHVKEDETQQKDNIGVVSMGLVGVAVLLVFIGFLLVRQWRKNPSEKIDSKVLNTLVLDLQTLTNGQISQGFSRIQNTPIPVPITHAITSRRHYRPEYPIHKRHSRSLHNLLASTQDSFHPLWGGLSLQALNSPSNILDWSLMNRIKVNGPIKKRRVSNSEENHLDDMSGQENGNILEFLNAKIRKDREMCIDEHSAGVKSETINNLQHIIFEEEPEENPYNTIDEDDLSVYDDARENTI